MLSLFAHSWDWILDLLLGFLDLESDAALRPVRTCFNPTHALVVTAAETLVRCRCLKHVETCRKMLKPSLRKTWKSSPVWWGFHCPMICAVSVSALARLGGYQTPAHPCLAYQMNQFARSEISSGPWGGWKSLEDVWIPDGSLTDWTLRCTAILRRLEPWDLRRKGFASVSKVFGLFIADYGGRGQQKGLADIQNYSDCNGMQWRS